MPQITFKHRASLEKILMFRYVLRLVSTDTLNILFHSARLSYITYVLSTQLMASCMIFDELMLYHIAS